MSTPSPPASPGPEAYNYEEHSEEGGYNYGRNNESDLQSPPASPVADNDQEPQESGMFRSPPASPGLVDDNDEPREPSPDNDHGKKNEAEEEGPRSPPSSPNYRSDDDDEDKDEANDTAERGQDDDEGEEEEQPSGEVGKLISNIFGDESDGEGEQEQQNEGYDSHIRAELQESEEEEKEWDFDRIIESKKKERGKKKRRRRDGSIDLCSNADGQIRHVVELMKDAAAADREANNQRRPAVQKTKMLEVVRSILLRADFFEALLENDMMSAISEWLAPLPDKSLPALEIRQISSDYSAMSRDERERMDLDHLPEVKRRRVEDRLSQGSSSQKINKPEERPLGPGDKGFINRARVPQKSTAAYIIRPKPKVEYTGPIRGNSKSSSNSRFDKAAREFKERTKSSKSQRAIGERYSTGRYFLSILSMKYKKGEDYCSSKVLLEENQVENDDKSKKVLTMETELTDLELLNKEESNEDLCTVGGGIERSTSPGVSSQRDFHAYQTSLFFFTQLGYLPVAGSMLSTTFFEPDQVQCYNQSEPDFNSLLIAWNHHCQQSSLTTVISVMVMLGGVMGAFLSGFLADSFGRKPVIVGCMVVICVFNIVIACIGGLFPIFTALIFCILGAASGGYMVTNLVLMVENLGQASSRLLVVSLNGWPIGMCFTSLIGYISRDWRVYHIIVSITAALLGASLQCISLESVRWLKHQNHLGRADKVQLKIDGRNVKVNGLLPKGLQSQDIEQKLPSLDETLSAVGKGIKKYTYLDLFQYKPVRTPLLGLVYCFCASSIVSFGFYFSVEILPGNRYINLASMGALKFLLGFIPFAVSFFVGRRPIIIISVGIAGISAWVYVIISWSLNMSDHIVITILGLLITASMDPTWKIIHLYSAELFPTVIRNMARGMCNVGARMGSLAAPMIVYSRNWFSLAPTIVFAVLLTIQWIVVFILFPETKDKPLPDSMEHSKKIKEDVEK